VITSETPFGGTFGIHYGGKSIHSISVHSSSNEFKECLVSLTNFTFLDVSKKYYSDAKHGSAWLIQYRTAPDSFENFVVDDKYVTGNNARVKIYPVLNLNINGKEHANEYRISIGGEKTGALSHQATHNKILSELHHLVGVRKAVVLGSSYSSDSSSLRLYALVDDSILYSSRKSLVLVGDVSTHFARGDNLTVGMCRDLFVWSVHYEPFIKSQGAGYIYDTKYKDHPMTAKARKKGFTVVQISSYRINLQFFLRIAK